MEENSTLDGNIRESATYDDCVTEYCIWNRCEALNGQGFNTSFPTLPRDKKSNIMGSLDRKLFMSLSQDNKSK